MSEEKPSMWKDLGDVGTLGIEMVLSVFLAGGIGYWLDGRLGTKPWLMVIGVILGMIAGLRRAYKVIVESGGPTDKPDKE